MWEKPTFDIVETCCEINAYVQTALWAEFKSVAPPFRAACLAEGAAYNDPS